MHGELLDGFSAMRDGVFDLLAQLGEALVIAVGDEERVIAKALGAVFLGSDASAHLTLELIFAAAHREPALPVPCGRRSS